MLPAFGNDPEMRCEPLGLARLITFSGDRRRDGRSSRPANRIVQLFEWTWDFRDIWMDGRGIPNVEDYLPRFNGYSVGQWEGDTLVVTSTGFDDRQWLDQYGFPISEQAVLEERWDRPEPEPVASPAQADRSGQLRRAMGEQRQGLGADPEGSDGDRRLVRDSRGSLRAERRVLIQPVSRPRGGNRTSKLTRSGADTHTTKLA